jgi:hypothetical protein
LPAIGLDLDGFGDRLTFRAQRCHLDRPAHKSLRLPRETRQERAGGTLIRAGSARSTNGGVALIPRAARRRG